MAGPRRRLSYRARKRLALVILLIGLPVYIGVVWAIMGASHRLPIWLELPVYIGLGFLWVLPFRFIFQGIGQADPDAGQALGAGTPADKEKAEGPNPSA